MTLSKEQLENIQKYASIYLPVFDIALLIDVHADELRDEIRNRSTPASIAYHKGKVVSRVTLHNQEMQLAKVGSPAAIENARRNLMDMEDDECWDSRQCRK